MATILIVDDWPANRTMLVALLRYRGHRMLEAGDGSEALAVVRADRPELIISDIMMPTMDGYELVRQLRADPALAPIPVIFFSANYQRQEAQTLAQACGVATILTKPCTPAEVLKSVEEVLGAAQPAPQEPPPDFDREHLRLLSDKLTRQVDELKIANDRLNALIDLSLHLGSERDPQKFLRSFCTEARKIFGARHALVGVVDDGPELRYLSASGMDAETVAHLAGLAPRQGILGVALDERRTVRQLHPSGDPVALGLPATLPPIRSMLVAPIVSLSATHGWLWLLEKLGADKFTADDEALAATLSAQVGRNYHHGRLYTDLLVHAENLDREMAERKRAEEASAKYVERLRLLHQIDRALIAGEEPEAIAAAALAPLRQLLDVPRAIVNQFDLKKGEVEWLAAAGRRRVHVGPGVRFSIRFMGDVEALRRGELQIIDVHALPPGPEVNALLASGVHAYVVVPMIARGELIGALSFGGGSAPLSAEQLSIAQEAAAQFALALAQARLHERDKRHAQELEIRVTERKQAVEALRQAQQRLEHVVVSSPAVLYTLAVEGEVLRLSWITDNVREITGSTVEEALQPNWWANRLHPDEVERVSAEMRDVLAHGRQAHEYRFYHRDGKYRWLRAELRLLRDAAGNPVEVVGSWSDITGRKQLEDQFRQAQKMEAVGRLAGGVAHDFNNLLTIINGYGELVLDAMPAEDPSRELIREMVAAGDRAAALTRQLLAFSRQSILEPKVLDLKALVSDVEKMLRRVIGADIQLAVVIDPELGAVIADAVQVEQVIFNLVLNARDAMPQGGRLTIELRNVELAATYIRSHPEARPGAHVLLAVSDTGCGMDQATMSRIFEPFFSTKGDKGTGLGLATVHGIVKQSGGLLDVYSEVGVGSTFKVYLPLVAERPGPREGRRGQDGMPRGNETVLLAEDEDGVRSLSRYVLQSCGYTVLEARDGAEAARVAAQHQGRIDLLLTDVVMPRMSGRELAEQLVGLRPGIKVLFLSGYTDDAVVRHGILEADVAFLQKPFSPAALAAKVRAVLDG